MNVRLTIILLLVAVVLLGGLMIAVLNDDKPGTDAILLESVAGLKADEIDTVEIVRTEPTEQKLTFVRTGTKPDRWKATEPVGTKADSFAVTAVVEELLKLKPTLYSDTPGNPADAGLATPSLKVTLRRGADKSATLFVGDTTAGKDKAVTFVATGDRPKVPVAVRRGDLDPIFKPDSGAGHAWELAKSLADFRNKRPLGPDLREAVTDLKAFKLTRDKSELAFTRTPAGDWVFAAPANYGAADVGGDPQARAEQITGVRPLLTALTGMQAFAADDVIEKPDADLAGKYGLGAGAIRVEFTPKDGDPEVLVIGKATDEKTSTGTKVYAQVPGDSAVFKLATATLPDVLAKLIADPAPLRDRSLVPALAKERIDAIDLTVAGSPPLKLRKVQVGPTREWVLYGGPTDPQPAGQAAKDLVDSLTQANIAKEVLPGANDAAFTANEIKSVAKVWTEATTPAAADPKAPTPLPGEPTVKGDPAYTITYGKLDGDTLFARKVVGGISTDMKVPNVLPVVGRSRLGYLSTGLESFATNAATKLVIVRGGETFEIVKDDKPDVDSPGGKWTFVKPDRLKGQTADAAKVGGGTVAGAGLVGLLSTLLAPEVAAEAPTPEQLKAFGLPGVTATVTLAPADKEKGKPTEKTFEFGAEVPGKGVVYARQLGGKNVVFTVLKATADRFATDDLRELTLYNIDHKKVSQVKFRGFKQAAGQPVEYVFDRKGPTEWTTTKSPVAGFAVDPAKLDTLLVQLRAPKAHKALGVGPTDVKFGLDPATSKNAIEITLKVEGLEPLIVLTLGDDTENGAAYFAWCSQRPAEAVVLPAAAFRGLKLGVESLKK